MVRGASPTHPLSALLYRMLTLPSSDFRPWLCGPSIIRRTAGCGPACPVVWQGRRGDPSPYADSHLKRTISSNMNTPLTAAFCHCGEITEPDSFDRSDRAALLALLQTPPVPYQAPDFGRIVVSP